jgi:hypothetical protein
MDAPYAWLVVANRAISPQLYPDTYESNHVLLVANLPALVVTRAAFYVFTKGYRSPELYLGTTVAEYELICWMSVSFLQWYWIGRASIWFYDRASKGRTADAAAVS